MSSHNFAIEKIMYQLQTDSSRFFVAGINYKKTDASIRSIFALNDDQYQLLLKQASTYGIQECFVISTCNRTEIYGVAENALLLIDLLCRYTEGPQEQFEEIAYQKQGQAAVQHLFRVTAGLDSQILGDYEILGQLKKAVKTAKASGTIGGFLERLTNTAFQCSKKIKTTTQISGGTVSVSFAAIQFLREKVADIQDKEITLIGTGKFGRNTCKNLVDYLQTRNITLINRTASKAAELATEMGLRAAPLDALVQHVQESDIILVATNSPEPILHREHFENTGEKIIIDLSIPYNVDEAVRHLPKVHLVNVDELSKMKDDTLARRKAEVPKAEAIINEHIAEFNAWLQERRHASALKAIKLKLREIHSSPLFTSIHGHPYADTRTDEKIQRIINSTASRMKEYNQQGCHYIEAINTFITTSS